MVRLTCSAGEDYYCRQVRESSGPGSPDPGLADRLGARRHSPQERPRPGDHSAARIAVVVAPLGELILANRSWRTDPGELSRFGGGGNGEGRQGVGAPFPPLAAPSRQSREHPRCPRRRWSTGRRRGSNAERRPHHVYDPASLASSTDPAILHRGRAVLRMPDRESFGSALLQPMRSGAGSSLSAMRSRQPARCTFSATAAEPLSVTPRQPQWHRRNLGCRNALPAPTHRSI